MKKIEVIGVPMKLGCMVEGAQLSCKYLKNSFSKVLNNYSYKEVDVKVKEEKNKDNIIKNIESVMNINKKLYDDMYDSFKNNSFPLVIGGDHSIAIGSIKGALDYYKGDVSVIYVDKHADIHNEKTTPSGNIHGMPLSVCIGRCDDRFDIGKYNLLPNNLYFLGLSNYEKEEIDYIEEKNIYNLKSNEIENDNIEDIVKNIKNRIKTKYVHISFDLDVINPKDFPAVNVSVDNIYQDENGLSYETTIKLLKKLLKEFNICSMDIVEYNPLVDKDNSCKEKIEEILKVINKSL